MHITTEKEISGQAAKLLREQSGLSQKEFWSPLGITQSGGSRYEKDHHIPKPVRILLYTVYVAGIPVDASTPEGAANLARLAKLRASDGVTEKLDMGAKLIDAKKHIKSASRLLNSITD